MVTDVARTRSWLPQRDDVMASIGPEDLRYVAQPLIETLR